MAAAPASFWMFLVNTGICPSLEKKSPRPASFNLTTLGSNVTCSGAEAASVAVSMMRDTVTVPCGVGSPGGGRKRTTALPAGLAGSGGGAGGAEMLRRVCRRGRDVRNQRDHQFLALAVDALATEQFAKDRNVDEPRDTGPGFSVLVLPEAAQKLHCAFGHADIVRNFALADDRLVDAAQVDVSGHARYIQVHMQGNIAVVMHAGRNFHVDADIDEGELSVDQRIDADAADTRLETAGGRGLAVADFQRRLHVVDSAQLWRLQPLWIGGAQNPLPELA